MKNLKKYLKDNCGCCRYQNGELLESSRRHRFSMPDPHTVVLCIERVEQADRGLYECRACNSVGSVFSKAYLNITGSKRNDNRTRNFQKLSLNLCFLKTI